MRRYGCSVALSRSLLRLALKRLPKSGRRRSVVDWGGAKPPASRQKARDLKNCVEMSARLTVGVWKTESQAVYGKGRRLRAL